MVEPAGDQVREKGRSVHIMCAIALGGVRAKGVVGAYIFSPPRRQDPTFDLVVHANRVEAVVPEYSSYN